MSVGRRLDKKLWKRVLFPGVAVFVSSTLTLFVVFAVLEIYPEWAASLGLESIGYYAHKERWQPDDVLVFLPRGRNLVKEYIYYGDLYRSEFGYDPVPVEYVSTFNEHGFRVNSSMAPFDIVVIGDSYVAFGERDDMTLSEMLQRASGHSTYNMGLGWYGPYQYLGLLQRYALDLKPKYALFCFFSGNDMRDTRHYERWRTGGTYYDYSADRGLIRRFFFALGGAFAALREAAGSALAALGSGSRGGEDRVHPDIGLVHQHERLVPMSFAYWNPPATAERLLDSGEWRALRNIVLEFKEESLRHGITPVLVYLPHKMEVYGELVSDQSGAEVRERLQQQLAHPDNSVQAFRALSEAVQVPLIDVTPRFRAAAREEHLLYYPFDTHWNPAGRELAAKIIAEELHELRPEPDRGLKVEGPPQ
jgi:hypothetical protein